jgi:hypothetical protein
MAVDRVRKTIAATLVAGGAWGIVLLVRLFGQLGEQWPIAAKTGQRDVFLANGAILLGFAALVAAALIGGVLLWKGKRLGERLSKVVLAAQLLFVAVPGFQYKVALLGFFGLGVTGSRAGFVFSVSTCMFLEFDPDDLWAFVVNIPALVMLLFLVRRPHLASLQAKDVPIGAPPRRPCSREPGA